MTHKYIAIPKDYLKDFKFELKDFSFMTDLERIHLKSKWCSLLGLEVGWCAAGKYKVCLFCKQKWYGEI